MRVTEQTEIVINFVCHDRTTVTSVLVLMERVQSVYERFFKSKTRIDRILIYVAVKLVK